MDTGKKRSRWLTVLVVSVSAIVVGVVLGLTLGDSNDSESASASSEALARDFDSANFSNSTTIDNKWMPRKPGQQFVLEGESDRGQGRQVHRIIFTVTDLTKMVDGVEAQVMWDQDINGGVLSEQELAFHAQDDDGGVWNLGEYPEEYEDGEFVGAPSTWIAGIKEMRAGILMRGDPQLNTSSYSQGWAPSVGFSDRAKVDRMEERNCVPVGCYNNVLVTDEWNPLEENDGHQFKYNAAGVGNIRVGAKGGDEQETLVLAEVNQLSDKEMAEARKAALKLDKHAYEVSPNVYGKTPPAQ